MNQTTRRAILALSVLALSAADSGRARADWIVSLSYSGRGGPDNAGLISTGNGSFSFGDDLSAVSLADLLTFDYTLEENTPNTARFGLSDLTSFSATVGPGLALTSLSLATGPVQGTNQETWPREFTVSSLAPGGSSTQVRILGVSLSLTSGTVTTTSVTPEPSAVALTALGGLIVAGCQMRRRATRTFA